MGGHHINYDNYDYETYATSTRAHEPSAGEYFFKYIYKI